MSTSARLRRVLGIGLALLVLIAALFLPQAFSLRLQPTPQNTWLLFFISALCFLAIVILTLVLARQVVKLYSERRAHVLGSQFKTKLVLGALGLSLTPVICMFGFTYGLINRTLDKWFSQPVVNVRDDTQTELALLTRYIAENSDSEVMLIAQDPALLAALEPPDAARIQTALLPHQSALQGGFAAIRTAGGGWRGLDLPAGLQPVPGGPAGTLEMTVRARLPELHFGGVTYMMSQEELPRGALAMVGMPIPAALISQMARLQVDRTRYSQLARDRRSLRLIYTGYLLLLTLAILFAATWMALRLSRLVTVPIADLAAATAEITRGNLAYRVRRHAADEVGVLVDSFNGMAAELEANRAQIEASRFQLERANRELDERRRYTETLLENTPSAVISLRRDYTIERVNPAVGRLFGSAAASARHLDELFDAACLPEIRHLLRKAERMPAASGQLETSAGGRSLSLAATVAALPRAASGRGPTGAGYVLVLEDLTDLLRIQKTAAWREVAQRIAHEIKNPLTPIALSAQRIRRKLPPATAGAEVIAECADTIEAEVRSLERLVNEFSQFARFPHAQPVTCNLNDIIERALRVFDGRLDGIEIHTRFADLPALRLDPEDMKRVFVNLIDNAAEALRDSPYRQITLSTHPGEGMVEAVVADTGPGLPPGDKARLFLPYYSTKARGSGLGLAIVQRIVDENGGSLRAEDNAPIGARFVIELPLEEAASQPAAGTVS